MMKKLIDKQVFNQVPNPKSLLIILILNSIITNVFAQSVNASLAPSNTQTVCPNQELTFTATPYGTLPTCATNFTQSYGIYTYAFKLTDPTSGHPDINLYGGTSNFVTFNAPVNVGNFYLLVCTVDYQYGCIPDNAHLNDHLTPYSDHLGGGSSPVPIGIKTNYTTGNLVISGPATSVANGTVTYSVPALPDYTIFPPATSTFTYNWQIPDVLLNTVVSGQNSRSITFTTKPDAISNQSITVQSVIDGCSAYPLDAINSNPYNVSTLDTPPTIPTGLTASAAASDVNTSINLSWTASTDNVVVQSYKVYYKNTTSATDQTWHSEIVTSPATTPITPAPTSVILTNLSEGKYQIYLVAIDNNGLLSGSENTIEYILDHTAPTSPDPVSPLEQTDFSLTLSWKQSTDAVGLKGYNLYAGTSTTPIASNITSTTYPVDITNLAIPIVFRVDAFDESGNTSSASYTLLTKVKPITVDRTNGYVGIGVNPPSERLDVDGNLKVRGNLNVLGDFYQNGNKLTLDSWISGGFQDPSGTWWGQLQNQWKQKLILAADVTELWGTMSAWAGVSVGGRNKWTAGGPDLVNGLPWYGIGLIDGTRGPANGFANGFNPVQVAGYYGIVMIDNTYSASTQNVALKIQNGRVGIGFPQNQNLTQALVVNGTVKASGLELPDGVINSIQNLGSWGRSGTSDIYRGAGNVGIGVVDPQELLHILNGNVKVESGSIFLTGSGSANGSATPVIELGVGNKAADLAMGTIAFRKYTDALDIVGAGTGDYTTRKIMFHAQGGLDILGSDQNYGAIPKQVNDNVRIFGNTRIMGKVVAMDVKIVGSSVVGSAAYPDYVFDKSYKLTSLSDLEKYIEINHHLPEVPSAKEVEKEEGFEVGKMNILLLKKVEELTLHAIEQEKKNKLLQERLEKLEKKKNN